MLEVIGSSKSKGASTLKLALKCCGDIPAGWFFFFSLSFTLSAFKREYRIFSLLTADFGRTAAADAAPTGLNPPSAQEEGGSGAFFNKFLSHYEQ